MWFRAIDGIAIRAHWKLVVLFKPGCPANDLSVPPPGASSGGWSGLPVTGGTDTPSDASGRSNLHS